MLLSALAQIAHGVGVGIGIQRCRPELFSSLGIEGPETPIVRGAYEHQTAGGHRCSGTAAVADELFAGRQRFVDAEHGLPYDLTRVRVHRDQLRPRRTLT